MRTGVTPVPIPNTLVKTCAAENTMLETAWEDRWLPDSLLRICKANFNKQTNHDVLTRLIKKHVNGGVAQLGEHLPCKQGVKSSNLSVSIGICNRYR